MVLRIVTASSTTSTTLSNISRNSDRTPVGKLATRVRHSRGDVLVEPSKQEAWIHFQDVVEILRAYVTTYIQITVLPGQLTGSTYSRRPSRSPSRTHEISYERSVLLRNLSMASRTWRSCRSSSLSCGREGELSSASDYPLSEGELITLNRARGLIRWV